MKVSEFAYKPTIRSVYPLLSNLRENPGMAIVTKNWGEGYSLQFWDQELRSVHLSKQETLETVLALCKAYKCSSLMARCNRVFTASLGSSPP
jgi:hypothetical protein